MPSAAITTTLSPFCLSTTPYVFGSKHLLLLLSGKELFPAFMLNAAPVLPRTHQDLAFVVDVNDMSPMHHSALTDNAASVSQLMKVGARVRCYDRSGHSPLAVACMSGSREAAHAILQQEGVVVNERDVRQRTPLHWAVSSGLASVAEELLERDADLSALDAQGSAPIHDAVHKGDADTVRILLRGGADIFMDDAQGALPLHVAAMAGSANACRVIVAHLKRNEAHTLFRLRAKGAYRPTYGDAALCFVADFAHVDWHSLFQAQAAAVSVPPSTLPIILGSRRPLLPCCKR